MDQSNYRLERRGYYFNLLAIGYAGGTLSAPKKEMIERLSYQMGITQEDMIIVMNNIEENRIFIPATSFARINHLYDLFLVAMSDGKINDQKIEALKKMAFDFDLDIDIIDSMLEKIIEKLKTGKNTNIVEEIIEEFDIEIDFPAEESPNSNSPDMFNFLDNVILYSNEQIKTFEDGSKKSGDLHIQIKITKNSDNENGFCILLFNTFTIPYELTNGIRQTKIISFDEEKIKLRGFGLNGNGLPISNLGATLKIQDKKVISFVFHYFDKKIDQEFVLVGEPEAFSFLRICETINREYVSNESNSDFHDLAAELVADLNYNFSNYKKIISFGPIEFLSKVLLKLSLEEDVKKNLDLYCQVCNYALYFYNKTYILMPSLTNNLDGMMMVFHKNGEYFRNLIEIFFIPQMKAADLIIHKIDDDYQLSKIIFWIIESRVLELSSYFPHWSNLITFHRDNLSKNQYLPTTDSTIYKDSNWYCDLFLTFLAVHIKSEIV